MTYAKKIPLIIADKKMTANQIASIMEMDPKNLYPVLNKLVKRGLIMKVNSDKRPIKYRGSTKNILLKNLYDIMMTKMKASEKLTKDEIITIKMIDEVLNK